MVPSQCAPVPFLALGVFFLVSLLGSAEGQDSEELFQ